VIIGSIPQISKQPRNWTIGRGSFAWQVLKKCWAELSFAITNHFGFCPQWLLAASLRFLNMVRFG